VAFSSIRSLKLTIFSILLTAALKAESSAFPVPSVVASRRESCVSIHDRNARISRTTLKWLIDAPIGSDRSFIEQRLGPPYCFLSEGERVSYPAAWDPALWLVIVYTGKRYQGYDFSFGNTQP
jgi:hypothetical protein